MAASTLMVTVLVAALATVTLAVAFLPSLLAVMVLVPGATPATAPLADTLAMEGLDELQVTLRPVKVTPALSCRLTVI